MQLSREALIRAYRQMKTIRLFEERLHDEIALGEIAGFTHLYAGQEACAVGVCERQRQPDEGELHEHHGKDKSENALGRHSQRRCDDPAYAIASGLRVVRCHAPGGA